MDDTPAGARRGARDALGRAWSAGDRVRDLLDDRLGTIEHFDLTTSNSAEVAYDDERVRGVPLVRLVPVELDCRHENFTLDHVQPDGLALLTCDTCEGSILVRLAEVTPPDR